MNASIAICTRDRAGALSETLHSLARGELAGAGAVELLLIDNGSSDSTRTVFEAAQLDFPKRYLFEPVRGVAQARNRALREFRGDIIVFVDDDIRVTDRWLEALLRPIRHETHQATLGFVTFPEYVHRALPRQLYYAFAFVDSELFGDASPSRIVTANFAVARSAIKDVAFDTALGPGALGFGEDTLFCWTLLNKGTRLVTVPEASVEHWVDPERLTLSGIRKMAVRMGRSQAYLHYHWLHERPPTLLPMRWLRSVLRTMCRASLARFRPGSHRWLLAVYSAQFYESYILQLFCERKFPPKYTTPKRPDIPAQTRCGCC